MQALIYLFCHTYILQLILFDRPLDPCAEHHAATGEGNAVIQSPEADKSLQTGTHQTTHGK